MAGEAPYLFFAIMDVDPEHEADFNEIYDKEHIPEILKVPGVRSAVRYRLDRGSRATKKEDHAKYIAIYEVDSPDVPDSDAFNEASDRGNWKDKVRPYTKNRSHLIYKRI